MDWATTWEPLSKILKRSDTVKKLVNLAIIENMDWEDSYQPEQNLQQTTNNHMETESIHEDVHNAHKFKEKVHKAQNSKSKKVSKCSKKNLKTIKGQTDIRSYTVHSSKSSSSTKKKSERSNDVKHDRVDSQQITSADTKKTPVLVSNKILKSKGRKLKISGANTNNVIRQGTSLGDKVTDNVSCTIALG